MMAGMNTKEALRELESLGTAQNRKVYGRHGVTGKAYGVSYANLGVLKKRIKTDHALAQGLWKSGVHDARVFATMIADPDQLEAATVDAWIEGCENYVLTDALAGLVAKSALGKKRAQKWIKSRDEWTSSAGWQVIAILSGDPEQFSEDELAAHLETIEAKLHKAPNRTRYAMNTALINIGLRSTALKRAAIAAARRIGPVEVDHGETGCKTPDAASYIEKTLAHRKKQAGKQAVKKGSAKKSSSKKKAAKKTGRKVRSS
jgi:3-methyladenine DNA glycosylase AlkD